MVEQVFFDGEVTEVARHLLGAELLLDGVGGIITETEAYHPTDAASHAFRGETPRNRTMFAGPGRVYVYRSYGIHWCLNLTCAGAAAVLIRALEPTTGIDIMRDRRGLEAARSLCSGPGKLAMALGVTSEHDGALIATPPFSLTLPPTPAPVITGPRIGITKAVDLPWRFGIAGSAFLSRAFPKP